MSSAIACPTDVMKIRMQARSNIPIRIDLHMHASTFLITSKINVLYPSNNDSINSVDSTHKFMNLCRTTDDKTLKVGLGIYRKEGIRGLWRGVGPTSQRSGLLAGVQVGRTDGDIGGGSGSGFF